MVAAVLRRWPTLAVLFGLLELVAIGGPLAFYVPITFTQVILGAPVALALTLVSVVGYLLGRRRVILATDDRGWAKVPWRLALLRAIALFLPIVGTAFFLTLRGEFQDLLVVVTVATLHGLAVSLIRGLVYARLTRAEANRRSPQADGVTNFLQSYLERVMEIEVITGGLAVACIAPFVYAFIHIPLETYKALEVRFGPAVAVLVFGWYLLIRNPPKTVVAYAQAPSDEQARKALASLARLPLRLAWLRVLLWLSAGAIFALLGHGLGIPEADAMLMFATVAIATLGAIQFEILWHRDHLRPLRRYLALHHRALASSLPSTVSLSRKWLVGTAGAVAFVGGIALLFGALQYRDLARVCLPTQVAELPLPWRMQTGAFLAFIGVASALALGLVRLLSRDLTRQIETLETHARAVSAGHLSEPIPPPDESDEVGRLMLVFEEMRAKIATRVKSAEELSLALEEQVEHRTAELTQTLTDLRRAQDELIRSEKLASMGRLVAGVAHEINNPINAVLNTLTPLEDELAEKAAGNDDLQQMLRVIRRGAHRTKEIVAGLHRYARGDGEKPIHVDVHAALDGALELLGHELKDRVEVSRAYAPSLPNVWGHPGQLEQVFLNLFANAAQALAGQPNRIGSPKITIQTRQENDRVLVTIADNGPGIPADILPHIFDPFFTTKDVGEGAGLGLSIVHGIIERHAGKIAVTSSPGEGTQFTIQLPIRASA